MTIEERLEQLRDELDACVTKADALDFQAEEQRLACRLLVERIQGIEEARRLLEPQSGNGAKPPRQLRRDIRAMVAKELPLLRDDWTLDEKVTALTNIIGCRPSQVRKAMAAFNP